MCFYHQAEQSVAAKPQWYSTADGKIHVTALNALSTPRALQIYIHCRNVPTVDIYF